MWRGRMKLSDLIKEETAWRIPVVSGIIAFVLGISSFGVAMKLSEYKNSPNLPPMLAGIPLVGAGIMGIVGGRTRRHWMISLHLIGCLIVGVLSIHLMVIFLGREADLRDVHKAKCQSKFQGSFFCQRYAATVAMSVVSVMLLAVVPMGILSYVFTRKPTTDDDDEEEEVDGPSSARPEESEFLNRAEDSHVRTERARPSSQPAKHTEEEPINYGIPVNNSQLSSKGEPSTSYEADRRTYDGRINQQRNLSAIRAAQNRSSEQEHGLPKASDEFLREPSGKRVSFETGRVSQKEPSWTVSRANPERARGDRISKQSKTTAESPSQRKELSYSDWRFLKNSSAGQPLRKYSQQ